MPDIPVQAVLRTAKIIAGKDVRENDRHQHIVRVRHAAIRAAADHGRSDAHLGRVFERDHAAIKYARQHADPELVAFIKEVVRYGTRNL